MNNIPTVSWQDILEIKNGKDYKDVIDDNGEYPIYGSGGIIGYANSYICPSNTVIIGRKGSINKPIFVETKFWNVDTAFGLVANEEYLYSKYLYYFCVNFNFERLNTTVTIPSLTKSNLYKIKMKIPPFMKQKQIAHILDKTQAIINARKKQIAKCDEYIKSVFYKMFGDPVTNPMRWEVRRLKNISTQILSGNTPKGGNQVYVKQGIIFLRSQNVWKNRLVLDDVAYIDEETHNRMSKSSLKNRDILMTKTGRINTENSSLGRAAMFLGEDDSANINGHVYLIRLQKNIINEFVLFILITNEYREYIRSICVGGIDKRQINKEHLEEFPIIFPPVELQTKFAAIVEKTEAHKALLKQSLTKMETLFNALMDKYFN